MYMHQGAATWGFRLLPHYIGSSDYTRVLGNTYLSEVVRH